MERYINFGGDADVSAFDISDDAIRVEFNNGDILLYTNNKLGSDKIEKMKNIAMQGGNLSCFISKHAKNDYDVKVREYRKA